jgi:hypothetical protein
MAASGQKREHEIFTMVGEGEPLNPLVFFARFNEKRRRERDSETSVKTSVHIGEHRQMH